MATHVVFKFGPIPLKDTGITLKMAYRAAQKGDEVFRKQMKNIFAQEGASSGTPWPDLDPVYKARKEREMRGQKARNKSRDFATGVNLKLRRPLWPRMGFTGFEREHVISTAILVRTGAMREAFAYKSQNHVGAAFWSGGALRFEFGAAAAEKYWPWHDAGKGKLKKRSMTRRSKRQEQEIEQALLVSLTADIKAAMKKG